MRWSLFYIFLNSLYQEVVPCCITHVWIITRQSKDAYEIKLDFMERGWLQVHFRGRNEGLHKNMGVVQWFGRAHFFKGLFARKYAAHTHTQEVQQLLEVFHLKNHWVSTDVVMFYVEFSSQKKQPCYHHLSSIRWEELDAKEAEHRSVSRDLINLKEDTE